MNEPPTQPDPPLRPDDLAEAVALWRKCNEYRRMSVSMAVVSLGHPFSVRPVGRRVELLIDRGILDVTE